MHGYDIRHIDLKTAFLQGKQYDKHRSVICQPPEMHLPTHFRMRLKRAAYGLNDAPRLWWNRLDAALHSYGLVPTRADRCCYVKYSGAPVHGKRPMQRTKDSVGLINNLFAHHVFPPSVDAPLREASADLVEAEVNPSNGIFDLRHSMLVTMQILTPTIWNGKHVTDLEAKAMQCVFLEHYVMGLIKKVFSRHRQSRPLKKQWSI